MSENSRYLNDTQHPLTARTKKGDIMSDTTINLGDTVRSFDFDSRVLTGNRATFVEGVVIGRVIEHDGVPFDCERYVIRCTRRVFAGKVHNNVVGHQFFPPVNGTPTWAGGTTNGVVKTDKTTGAREITDCEPCIHCGAPIDDGGCGHDPGCTYADGDPESEPASDESCPPPDAGDCVESELQAMEKEDAIARDYLASLPKCGACNGTCSTPSKVDGVFVCDQCGGLNGTTDRESIQALVKIGSLKSDSRSTSGHTRYFDFMLTADPGTEAAEFRTHGWYDTADGRVVQYG